MPSNDPIKRSSAQVRSQLLNAARSHFVALPFDKVSIRKIAEQAQVNMAMIRYYFGNKLGLFEAMVQEFSRPMQEQFALFKGGDAMAEDPQALTLFMQHFYDYSIANPEFPRFIFRTMTSEPSIEAQNVVINTLSHLQSFFTPEGINTERHLMKMSLMSLLIFPFLMPERLAKIHGFELNETFYRQLAEHNLNLLHHGLNGEIK